LIAPLAGPYHNNLLAVLLAQQAKDAYYRAEAKEIECRDQ